MKGSNREYVVTFSVRKGLGPEYFDKSYTVGLDDIEPEMSETEIETWARYEAESHFYNGEDYMKYGKYWQFKNIQRI